MNTIPFLPTYDYEAGTVRVPLRAPKPPHDVHDVVTLDIPCWHRVVKMFRIDPLTAQTGRDKGREAVRSRVRVAPKGTTVPLAALVVGGVLGWDEEIAYADGDFKNLRLSNLSIVDRADGSLIVGGEERLCALRGVSA